MNGTEREDRSSTQNERNETERNENGPIKKERERNDLAEGPRSRTERNDFKKVRTCPALGLRSELRKDEKLKVYEEDEGADQDTVNSVQESDYQQRKVKESLCKRFSR